MDFNFFNRERYETILQIFCKTKGIKREELVHILKDRECRYLLFLLLKKYKCMDMRKLHEDFYIESKKKVDYSFKKAEERFFINKEFRDAYFEIENIVEESI